MSFESPYYSLREDKKNKSGGAIEVKNGGTIGKAQCVQLATDVLPGDGFGKQVHHLHCHLLSRRRVDHFVHITAHSSTQSLDSPQILS